MEALDSLARLLGTLQHPASHVVAVSPIMMAKSSPSEQPCICQPASEAACIKAAFGLCRVAGIGRRHGRLGMGREMLPCSPVRLRANRSLAFWVRSMLSVSFRGTCHGTIDEPIVSNSVRSKVPSPSRYSSLGSQILVGDDEDRAFSRLQWLVMRPLLCMHSLHLDQHARHTILQLKLKMIPVLIISPFYSSNTPERAAGE